MNCAILTPLALEFEAVKCHLPNWKPIGDFPYYAIQGSFKGQHATFQITLVQTVSKTNPTTLATEKIIQHFQPTLLFLTGIAGGVKDAKIGDVVVATQAYGYESGKETTDGFVARPNVKPFSTELLQQAKAATRQLLDKKYQVFFGPIASGDKVIASTDSPVYQRLKLHYNDTLALEMEAIGFAEATAPYRSIHALNIRSISDLLNHKSASDAEGTQELAAANAADFVFELLNDLNPNQLNIPTMDVKKLAKEVVNLVFPLLKFDTVQTIGSQLKEATNTSIKEMWEKVSPVFIEEFEAEVEAGEDLKDHGVQAGLKTSIQTKLKRKLSKEDELATSLGLLWEKYQASASATSNVVSNSKNVIQGSMISAGGDIVIGDQTSSIGQQVNNYGKIGKQVNIESNEGDMHF